MTPEVRYNCLGYPYRPCEVCGHPEVRITKSGKLHGTHLKGQRHRKAVLAKWVTPLRRSS